MRISDWSSDGCSSDLCMLVDVGGENLDARDPLQPVHVLAQEHCNGISLLARRATRHPYTHRIVRAATVEKLWYDQLGKRSDRAAVAKERSEERRVGEEGASKCRYRGWPYT